MGILASLALVAKVGKFDPRLLYAGWSDDGLPILTINVDDLSEEATGQAKTFLSSGYPIPTLLVRRRQIEVVVVEFAGPVQDLKDPSPRNLVQDTIKILVKNSSGDSEELTLGELEVLEMIGSNTMIFQRFGSVLDTSERQEAVSYFSFFLPGSEELGRQDLLVLLRPTNDNLGNLVDAIIFIQDVIKKLLMNDERQPKEFRKGYLDAGKEAEDEIKKELNKSKGLFDFLFVPEDKNGPSDSLKEMILDFVTVPADGSKPRNPFLGPSQKAQDSTFDRKTLDRLRHTASKMFLFARSRIR